MRFSLVIPCFNEAKNLPVLLDRCSEVTQQPGVEVILVNNGSTDETSEVFHSLNPEEGLVRMIHLELNQGYGHGILSGLAAAHGRFLGWTHADLQTDPRDSLKGLELLERLGPSGFVKGSRRGRSFGDQFFTFGMSVFETGLLRTPLWDINAQPTLFSRSFYEAWGAPPHDFSLDLFAFYWARRLSMRIKRFPVRFHRRVHGTSSWNVSPSARIRFIRRTLDFSFQLRRNVLQ